MTNYDFKNLNSTEFENLVCDLMNLDLPKGSEIKYRTFTEGRDKGIDFLFSTDEYDYEHVGQVKHFVKSSFSTLKNTLVNSEKEKVRKLKPNRYIFTTSQSLSTENVLLIKEIFTPYIKSLGDIYGYDNLNNLVSKYPQIIDSYFKLWLSDFENFNRILNSKFIFRSTYFNKEQLQRRLRLYVETPTFQKARADLRKNKFILITGNPGVGKTTLAEMLVYEYISEGYSFTYVFDDIRDVETALEPDEVKQVFYFDDFLGSNKLEIAKAKSSEAKLMRILRMLTSMKNKVIIFTTRIFLLNDATQESEQLKRFRLKAKSSYLPLSDYSKEIKNQILKNHIEESDIDEEYKLILNELSDFIVNNNNFSPRSIEFITDKGLSENIRIEDFRKYVINNFDNPKNIWEHAYINQIQENDRILLNTLFCFEDSVSINLLKQAYIERKKNEVLYNNGKIEISEYEKVLSRLEKGFVAIKNDKISLINHSLHDFLFDFIKKETIELNKISDSIISIQQLNDKFFDLFVDESLISENLKVKLIEDYKSFLGGDFLDNDLIQLCIVLYRITDIKDSEGIICEIIQEIDDWSSLQEDYELNELFNSFLNEARDNYNIKEAVNEVLGDVIGYTLGGIYDLEKLLHAVENFTRHYDVDFSSHYFSQIKTQIEDAFEEYITNEVDWLHEWANDEYYVDEKREEIDKFIEKFKKVGFTNIDVDTSSFDIDWYDVLWRNEMQRLMAKDD